MVAVLGGAGALSLETVSLERLGDAAIDIAFVGLMSSAITFTLLTVAMQYTPPSEAAIIVSTETLFAAAAAYLALGERLSAIGWAGAVLILSAIVLVQAGGARGKRPGTA